ncbi:MAG TPA: DUF6507 family protein [Mycobacteriales bacterium]|nr:DUF6507 family protein [Mycobacteriales bacterium]
MPYDIQPRETDRVSIETTLERDQLEDNLDRVVPLVDDAMGGTRPSAPVTAELDHFVAEHYKNSREILARINSALEHGRLAVDAYVQGDATMAEQYGRAATVFDGPILPFTPPPARELPEKVEG